MCHKSNVLGLYRTLLRNTKYLKNSDFSKGIKNEIRYQFRHHQSISIHSDALLSYINDGYKSLEMLKYIIHEQENNKKTIESLNKTVIKLQENNKTVIKCQKNNNKKWFWF